MTEAEQTLLMVRGQIASLPKPDQAKIEAVAMRFRYILNEDADHGRAALALVGAEQAAAEE